MKKNLIQRNLNEQTGSLLKPYSVTFISNDEGNAPTISFSNGQEQKLKVGDILTDICHIKTNSHRVEITSSNGTLFRLGLNSEFSIEKTIEGVVPVYYGEVYVEARDQQPTHKYYTSCWCESTTIFIDNISDHEDYYYTLDFPATIYEYDEEGNRFDIFKQLALTKTSLTFDDNKPMRDRYKIKYQKKITQSEIDYIVSNFVNPNNWIQLITQNRKVGKIA